MLCCHYCFHIQELSHPRPTHRQSTLQSWLVSCGHMPELGKGKQAQILLQQHPFHITLPGRSEQELSSGGDNRRQVDGKLGDKETTAAPSLRHEGYRKETARELQQFLFRPICRGYEPQEGTISKILPLAPTPVREGAQVSQLVPRRDTMPAAPTPGAFFPTEQPRALATDVSSVQGFISLRAARDAAGEGDVVGRHAALLPPLRAPLQKRRPPRMPRPPSPGAVPCRRRCGAGAGRGWG